MKRWTDTLVYTGLRPIRSEEEDIHTMILKEQTHKEYGDFEVQYSNFLEERRLKPKNCL
jgi:hypothetical protein